VVQQALASLLRTRTHRDAAAATAALTALRAAAVSGSSIMPASIACAHARVTTGEWTDTLRSVFGEYRAVTGIASVASSTGSEGHEWAALQARVEALVLATGHRPRLLVGKPGLDGHSNGAEMIAVAARDAGFEVIFAGIRSDAAALAATAVQEGVDILGLSILSGSHIALCTTVLSELAARGAGDIPVVVGGIVPTGDRMTLLSQGVKRVFTPSDFRLVEVVSGLLDVMQAAQSR
jgi:ethylmalonyl-CoA mutase